MSDFRLILEFLADTIQEYLVMMNSMWYTQVIMYIVVLGCVVSVLVTLRR